MATKLKKSDNKIWRWLTKSSVKFIAMVLVCLCVGTYISSTYYVSQSGISDLTESEYTRSGAFRHPLNEMYERLCIYSSFYLRNQDDKGEYTGSEYLLSDFKYYLYFNNYKYDNSDNNIHLLSDMFDYYVSFIDDDGNVRFSDNIENEALKSAIESNIPENEKLDKLKEYSEYYILRKNNEITSSNNLKSFNYYDYYSPIEDYWIDEPYNRDLLPVGASFYDNYGRYMYNYGNEESIIFYDFERNSQTQWIADGYDTESGCPIEELTSYNAYLQNDSGIVVYIAPKSDILNQNAAVFKESYTDFKNTLIIWIVSSILWFILVVYLFIVCGCHCSAENGCYRANTKYIEKIYTEIYFILMLAAFIFESVVVYTTTVDEIFSNEIQRCLFCGLLSAVLFAIGFGSVLEVTIKIKTRTFFSDSIIFRFIKWIIGKYHKSSIYKAYCEKSIGSKLIGRTIKVIAAFCAVMICAVIDYIIEDYILFSIVSIIAAIVVGICEYKNIKDFRQFSLLSKQIDALVSDEDFRNEIEETSALYNDSKKLECISETVKNSIDEQMKSERMKIELIANVSHDLKTPLTSIISYIDLLKKLELNDEAMAYVKILDKKSQKLKSIVSDVFTLAKATSGIDVKAEKIDFVMLFNQAVADADDKINLSGKTIKTEINESSAFVLADGDKMYRVFQNLIDNALNYSMDGTRIFLNIYKDKENIVFETKNVSSYPIEFTADEIVERFVRGDKSRTDGGSGLGLSIAKSFTEACGGSFRIDLDGDMFKTTVSMPIIKEEEISEQENENSEENRAE